MSSTPSLTNTLLNAAYFPQQSQQQDLFSKIDVNGDGQITPDEMSSFGQNLPGASGKGLKNPNLFQKIDTNGDGVISKDEWGAHRQQRQQSKAALLNVQEQSGTQGHRSHHGGGGVRQANQGSTFNVLDTNKDGVVSADEWAAAYGNTGGATISSDVQSTGVQSATGIFGGVTSAANSAKNTVTNAANSLAQTLNTLI
jgi:hypothetical protein